MCIANHDIVCCGIRSESGSYASPTRRSSSSHKQQTSSSLAVSLKKGKWHRGATVAWLISIVLTTTVRHSSVSQYLPLLKADFQRELEETEFPVDVAAGGDNTMASSQRPSAQSSAIRPNPSHTHDHTDSDSSQVNDIQVTDKPHIISHAGRCHFEEGKGQFNLTRVAYEGDWTWQPEACRDRYLDYIDLLTNENNNNGASHEHVAPKPKRTQPLNLISIGDSLSRHQVEWLCEAFQFDMLPQLYNGPDLTHTAPLNSGKWRDTMVNVCQDSYGHNSDSDSDTTVPPPSLSIASFNIFGMKRPCNNGGVARHMDSRQYKTTVDQVNALLRPEVLDRVPKEGRNVFWVHSGLWDISDGCNDAPTIDPENAREYKEGIQELKEALEQIDPSALIYWRTAPPMTRRYNRKSTNSKRGRSRANQLALNMLLKETAPQGTVIDWWQQVEGVMNKDDKLLGKFIPDGIHYDQSPSLSAYNMFLNTIFDQQPGLWSETHGTHHGQPTGGTVLQ